MTDLRLKNSRSLMYLELLATYFLIPLLIVAKIIPRAPLVYLVVISATMFVILHRKYNLKFSEEWGNLSFALSTNWRKTLLFRLVGCFLVCLLWILLVEPTKLFEFPKRAPFMWGMVVFLYPLLSVVPQEIIYRTFYFRRYSQLFSSPSLMALINALAFGASHLIFYSTIGLILSFIGGIFLADTYQKTRTLSAVWLEHSLYGLIIFTLGLGKHFYAPEFG